MVSTGTMSWVPLIPSLPPATNSRKTLETEKAAVVEQLIVLTVFRQKAALKYI